MSALRVIQVVASLDPQAGSLALLLRGLCLGLQAKGVSVSVVSVRNGDPMGEPALPADWLAGFPKRVAY